MVTVEGEAQIQIYVGSNLPKPFWWKGSKYSRIVAVAPPSFHFDCKSLHLLPFCFEFEFTRWHVRTQLDSWINLTLPLSIRHTTTTRWASIKYWEPNTRYHLYLNYKVQSTRTILDFAEQTQLPPFPQNRCSKDFSRPRLDALFERLATWGQPLPSFPSIKYQTHLSPSLSFSWSH